MAYPTEQLGTPSYEEGVLLALNEGNLEPAVEQIVNGLYVDRSPGVLSVVRADLLGGLSMQVHSALAGEAPGSVDPNQPKARAFDRLWDRAAEGDPAAISALPKLATTVGQVVSSTELILDNLDAVSNWRTGRPYVQFIGSFNPQHVGHRSTIRDTLAAAGDNASGIVQVVQNHPIKKDSLPPYEGRFTQGEDKLYSSTIIDPTTATLLDLPLGLGLAKRGAAQIELLANVTGDEKMRWLVGSDKFMTDVKNVRDGKALDKAGVRFSDVHLYVARRDTETTDEVEDGANYVRDRFGAEITILPETQDPLVLQAAASKIRTLRAEGRHNEADRMEYIDIIR